MEEQKKSAKSFDEIQYKTSFIDIDDPKPTDFIKRTTFKLEPSANDCVSKKSREEVKDLIRKTKAYLDPIFGTGKQIVKFFQADLNDWDSVTNKPVSDMNNWVNIFDRYGDLVKDEYGNPIMNIYSVNVIWNLEIGPVQKRLHSHVQIDVEHDGNLLLDRDFLQKYLNHSYERVFGRYKVINFRLRKDTDFRTKYLNYMRGNKQKIKPKKEILPNYNEAVFHDKVPKFEDLD